MDWKRTTIASDGTHHELDGLPLYDERFEEVLPFHAPGRAPVRKEDRAWHIDASGCAVYERRFLRAFGFYEGRAAVTASDGWHHILPEGSDLYTERYAWCGNFQGGRCAAREPEGQYLHVDREGRPAYAQRWRYAGDFRHGVAVVQGPDGRSTHIDSHGRPVHGAWFLDLDVFHKGFARAQDEDGWMHIGRDGLPIYGQRFAMVEPFYNGQARVERLDGSLELIDEDGVTVLALREGLPARAATLITTDEAGTIPKREGGGLSDLPESLVRSLERIPRDARRVLFVRHADRDPIPTGSWGDEIRLNEAGMGRAQSLTAALPQEPRWAISSPIDRCRQTAAIATGSVPAQVETHWLLGAPGPFVVDRSLGQMAFGSLGTRGVVRHLIDTGPLKGFRSAAEGQKLVCDWARSLLGERGGSGILVTHDAIVAPVVARLFGEPFESRWPEFLDGIVFTIDAGGSLLAHWDGLSVEVHPC